MARDPFEVLGLRLDCTQAEAQDRYVQLRQQYMNDRFLEGDAGDRAARNLTELEDAYGDLLEILSNRYSVEGGGNGNYDAVISACKEGRFDEAQAMLDAMTSRGAEWNYQQAQVYYRRGWLNDARKQLKLAITLDPSNQKYQNVLAKLEKKMQSSNPFSASKTDDKATTEQPRSYAKPGRATSTNNSGCCEACQCLICTDCLCECLGGDCISCC